MNRIRVTVAVVLFTLALSAGVRAQAPGDISVFNFEPQGNTSATAREDELYNDGAEYLDDGEWQRALEKFTDVVAMKGRRADAALYWKAYALGKLGRRQEALNAIAELRRSYPQSKWVKDAGALEMEFNQERGIPPNPDTESNCELKVMALNSLMDSNEERAIPMIENLLQSNSCPKAKDKALFVLSQSDSPRAQAVLVNIARGQNHPELQRAAIRNLGLNGTPANKRALVEIYNSTNDTAVKSVILQAFLTSDAEAEVLNIARTDPDPNMRRKAIQQLGAMGAHDALHQLYRSATTVDDKREILMAAGVSDDVPFLAEVAKAPGNVEVRKAALHGLGISGESSHGPLLEIYGTERDPEIRRAVIEALFVSDACDELVDLARKETDPQMKRALFEKLSVMDCRKARDFMIEILNK